MDKKIVTRKEHSCWGCGTKFPKGSLIKSVTTFTEGPQTTYWCDTCDSFLKKYSDDFKDGVYFSEFRGEEEYENFKKERL